MVRGEVYRLQNKLTEALEDLNKVLKEDSNNILALASRGEVYFRQNNLPNAQKDLNTAMALALSTRAEIHCLQDNLSHALDDLNRLIMLYPDHTFAIDEKNRICHLMNIN